MYYFILVFMFATHFILSYIYIYTTPKKSISLECSVVTILAFPACLTSIPFFFQLPVPPPLCHTLIAC